LGEVLTTPQRKNVSRYEIFTQKVSDKNEDQYTFLITSGLVLQAEVVEKKKTHFMFNNYFFFNLAFMK